MTIHYQSGDFDAQRAVVRGLAAALEACRRRQLRRRGPAN
jgi:hypothetical protein